jgi:hypothetical protein
MGSTLGTNLAAIDYLFLVAPVVLVLFTWIAVVYWADAHPDVRRTGQRPTGYLHQSYARTDDDALAGESSPAMSAADEEPAAASQAAGESEAAARRAGHERG